ncbi:TonB-dependent receptor [Alloalcanivorax dieselolei B5]|uniref:TonB-dependent receptor n=1 Tax=Alcanivorax dieselolei (strain DSM 16502 / CGMCC 1.3690 / MCCC 1A00001 / B-5) TaxID=930169 RepID=K0CGS2_ALCDB|nr:TonB-dependent receptor [Alloalcanivorax dieselolei]AFT70791.1 TonB-dependent receptor [Alloalcanivorax dieselolei B5]GGJ97786.1 TonB-dependent receptor [Alloalcanivorax dieselolei]
MFPLRRHPTVVALLMGLALPPLSSHADTRKDGAESVAPHELESVTVTARRGEEQAKEVPFGLSVIDAETLESKGNADLETVLRDTAGVNISSSGPYDANVLIRGVGSLNQISQEDGSVVLNVDGVALSARQISLATLDMERVEVLKGPQGTLFGRNSEAGAINVVSRRPTDYREGYLRGEYGQDNQYRLEGALSGPLGERLSGRLAVRQSGEDHWVENVNDGDPISQPRSLAFRGSLLWDVGERTSMLFIAERQRIRHDASVQVLYPFGDPPGIDMTSGRFDDNQNTVERYSAEVQHDFAGSRLTSTTALVRTDMSLVTGYGRRISEILYGAPMEFMKEDDSDQRVVSQDLNLSSLPGARVFWVAGLYASDSRRNFDSFFETTGNRQNRDYDTRSSALYGEATYPLTDRLDWTFGLRHTWDRKTYEADYFSGSWQHDKRDLDDDYTTGRTGLSFAVIPDLNLYAMLARGYKSGLFSDYATQVEDSKPTDAAKVNSLEIGFKLEPAHQRYAINGAVFISRVKDDHLLGYDAATQATSAINADTRSQGAELEGTLALTPALALSASVTYIDAEITSDAPGVQGGDVASGNRVPQAARWSGDLALTYQRELPEFLGLPYPMLKARAGYHHVGTRPADPQNHFDLDHYDLVDTRVTLLTGNAEFYVYGDNLLNERYELSGYQLAPGVRTGAMHRGRIIGVGAGYYF